MLLLRRGRRTWTAALPLQQSRWTLFEGRSHPRTELLSRSGSSSSSSHGGARLPRAAARRRSPYLVLGVPTHATAAAIRARFRALAKTHHPDMVHARLTAAVADGGRDDDASGEGEGQGGHENDDGAPPPPSSIAEATDQFAEIVEVRPAAEAPTDVVEGRPCR
jgi:hypothetical protein